MRDLEGMGPDAIMNGDTTRLNWLALGIESGSKHVRDGASKKFGQEDIAQTVRTIQDAGTGVRVFRRRCLTAWLPFEGSHRYFAELMTMAGHRVVEIPPSTGMIAPVR